MANPTKQPIDNKALRALICELLIEWNPQLKNDPQKLNDLMMSVEQDFYALATNKPELVQQSMTALQPLIAYLVGKQLELHTPPQLKPNPLKSLQKKCDELIEEICKDEPNLKLTLKNLVKETMGQANDPQQTAEAVNTLHNLSTVLKNSKFSTKPIFEFLSDKDKANMSYYAMNPETGTHQTVLTKIQASPPVIAALTDAIKLTVAPQLNISDQPSEGQNQNRPLPTPFHTKPTPDKNH